MTGVVLVLGGASGIGAAVAQAMAESGHVLGLADLSLGAAIAAAGSLSRDGHRGYEVDVADESSLTRCFDDVERDLGPIRVLLTAAGVGGLIDGKRPSTTATPVESWDHVMRVNARGTFLAIREMLRRRENSPLEHSRIITVASIAAQTASGKGVISYAASKGAVLAMTRLAATEAAPLGMTANAVAPGAIDTPLLRAAMPSEGDLALFKNSVAGRIGRPDEIAAAIAFLASPAASYINGACIDVNGGIVMR